VTAPLFSEDITYAILFKKMFSMNGYNKIGAIRDIL
jgi:hypothetical protein